MVSLHALRQRSHSEIARLLASVCIFLYLVVFGVLFYIGASHGASWDQMIGLTLGEHRDTVEYKMLAETMLSEGRYALTPTAPLEAARVPGYPAFVAGVLWLCGTMLAIPFIQIAFVACTVALIYLIGIRYFPRSVALFAALVYMLDPIVIFTTWWPLSEALFIVLFMASIYAIATYARRSWIPALVAGGFLGLSAYVRPLGQYVAPLIALLALMRADTWRIGVRNAAIFLVAALAVMSPWFVRNYAISGHVAFSSIQGWHLFINMSLFEQFRTGISFQTTQASYQNVLGTSDEHLLRQFKYSDQLREIALEKYAAHPFQYLMLYAVTAEKLFISSSIVKVKYHFYQAGILQGELEKGEGAWGMIVNGQWRNAFVQTFTNLPRLAERIFWALTYLSAVITAIVVAFRRGTEKTLRVWVITTFLLIHLYALLVAPWTDDTRYRMPIEPFLLMLGGYGFYLVIQYLKKISRMGRLQRNA